MIRLERAGYACPEQWNAFRGEEYVGYLHYCWGRFTVLCPDVGGKLVYEATIDPNGHSGIFTKDERNQQLKLAVMAIEDWLEIDVTGEFQVNQSDMAL